jgi:hypothetical protein
MAANDTTAPDPDEMISVRDAARIAGLARGTLLIQARRGHLTTRRLGNILVLSRRDLHEYLRRREAATRGKKAPLPPDYRTPRGLEPIA